MDFVINYLQECKRVTLTIKVVFVNGFYERVCDTFVHTNYSRVKNFISLFSDKFSNVTFLKETKVLVIRSKAFDYESN